MWHRYIVVLNLVFFFFVVVFFVFFKHFARYPALFDELQDLSNKYSYSHDSDAWVRDSSSKTRSKKKSVCVPYGAP